MSIDNQTEYWNKVAGVKTFTHPFDEELIQKYLDSTSHILDFGCGYGRTVKELIDLGYTNVVGFDTSSELISRGKEENELPLFYMNHPNDLSVLDNAVDCIILFAVLTCIPSNKGQIDLLTMLKTKLKQGGILYISDYYLQPHSQEMKRYEYLNGDKNNYGVFTLQEGVTFRHHTKEWIEELIKGFKLLLERPVEVTTMNGHSAMAFQIVVQKE